MIAAELVALLVTAGSVVGLWVGARIGRMSAPDVYERDTLPDLDPLDWH